ncbi:MAG: hypothetical protein Q4F25_03765, partial [Eubacteriales bacterium]|nr:hypothetical protein [Eubacteriales bacterium]
MKRILAVACAAALVLTSVPSGVAAYAEEVPGQTTEQEQKADEAPAQEQKQDVRASEEQKPEEEPAQEQKSEEQSAQEQKSEEASAEEQKPEEKPTQEQKSEEQPSEEQKAEEEAKQENSVKEEQPAPDSDKENKETRPAEEKAGGASDAAKPQDEGKKVPDKSEHTAGKAGEQKTTSKSPKNAGDSKEKNYTAEITIDPSGDIYVGDTVTFSVTVRDDEENVVDKANYKAEWTVNGSATESLQHVFSGGKKGISASVKIKIGEEVVATASTMFDVYDYSIVIQLPENGQSTVKCGEELNLAAVVKDKGGNIKAIDDNDVRWLVSSQNGDATGMGSPTGKTYAFKAAKPGDYKVTMKVLLGSYWQTVDTNIRVIREYTLKYYDNVDDPDEAPSKTVSEYINGDALLSAEDAGVSKGNYSFAGWSLTKNGKDSELYHYDGDKWYLKSGDEFEGFDIEDDTVKLYAQWTDNEEPQIDITITELQFSANDTAYTQDEVVVKDTVSGISTIYYAIGSSGTEPTDWDSVTFGTDDGGNPTREKYTFTVKVPAKGVLWVKAEDNAEQVITVDDSHKVSIEDGPNTAAKEGFSLVFEKGAPTIGALSSEAETGGSVKVNVTAT